MTGSKHNLEGNSGDRGEADPGPYWRRMHRDWRFWVGAVFMAARACYLCSERRPCLASARSQVPMSHGQIAGHPLSHCSNRLELVNNERISASETFYRDRDNTEVDECQRS